MARSAETNSACRLEVTRSRDKHWTMYMEENAFHPQALCFMDAT